MFRHHGLVQQRASCLSERRNVPTLSWSRPGHVLELFGTIGHRKKFVVKVLHRSSKKLPLLLPSMQRPHVSKRRSPLMPVKWRPALSLPIPSAVYRADLAPAGYCCSDIVVPLRLNPHLLSCCEDGTAEFALSQVNQVEIFDLWGRRAELPSSLRWQASCVVGQFQSCQSGVRPCLPVWEVLTAPSLSLCRRPSSSSSTSKRSTQTTARTAPLPSCLRHTGEGSDRAGTACWAAV